MLGALSVCEVNMPTHFGNFAPAWTSAPPKLLLLPLAHASHEEGPGSRSLADLGVNKPDIFSLRLPRLLSLLLPFFIHLSLRHHPLSVNFWTATTVFSIHPTAHQHSHYRLHTFIRIDYLILFACFLLAPITPLIALCLSSSSIKIQQYSSSFITITSP